MGDGAQVGDGRVERQVMVKNLSSIIASTSAVVPILR